MGAITEETGEEVVEEEEEEEVEEAEENGNLDGQELDDEKLHGIMCNLMHFKEKIDVDHVV